MKRFISILGFLLRTLRALGLNRKEREDFTKFYIPRMNSASYYRISFLDRQLVDVVAPLRIAPKPDHVIRVYMDLRPLEKAAQVVAPILPATPARGGFTVVDWCGLFRGTTDANVKRRLAAK